MTESEFKALERKYEVHIPYSNGYENGYADAEAKWLSVIEKIKAEIHNEITSGGKWSGGWYEVTEEDAIKKFDEIIDKAVKERTHET